MIVVDVEYRKESGEEGVTEADRVGIWGSHLDEEQVAVVSSVPLGIAEEVFHGNGVVLTAKSDHEIAWHVDICAISIDPVDILVVIIVALSEVI